MSTESMEIFSDSKSEKGMSISTTIRMNVGNAALQKAAYDSRQNTGELWVVSATNGCVVPVPDLATYNALTGYPDESVSRSRTVQLAFGHVTPADMTEIQGNDPARVTISSDGYNTPKVVGVPTPNNAELVKEMSAKMAGVPHSKPKKKATTNESAEQNTVSV